MSRSKFLLAACVWCSLCSVQVTAAVMEYSAPAGLGPGDTFHWVFVTSTMRNAVPTSIDPYNVFVNDAADAAAGTTNVVGVVGVTELGQINWKAIAGAKASAVDARDNIGDPTSPIYRLDGAPVANSEADLFDASIANPVNLTEIGTTYAYQHVWTGTWDNGTAWEPLGGGMTGTQSGEGLAADGVTAGSWIAIGGVLNISSSLPLYAISPELTVVPLPGAVLLGILGLSVAGVKLRKFT